jgi:type I restriction enzyme S subunit
MIADLLPYAEYKDSGLPWLGQVPAHWKIKRGKAYLTTVDVRSRAGKEELLTVSSERGVVPRRTANVTMFKAESYAGHKLCWPGDLVINSLWAWGGGLGVSQHHGIISTAYSVYRSRTSAGVVPRFLHELVRSAAFHWELQVRSKGVWISRLQLTDTAFLDAPIPLPPPEEQAAIVRFLDWANRRLDRAIRAKRKVIVLLNEQKQAIIYRAVTRGLDPNVKLKDSGVHRLGEIPAHWTVRNLRQLLEGRTKRGRPDLPLLSVVREKGIIIRDTENAESNHNFIPDDLTNYKVVESGQFVMNKMKAWQGSYGVSEHTGIVSPAYYVFDLRGVEGAFFHVALRSKAYVPFFTQASDGVRVGQWDLNQSRMREIRFYYPTSSEQLKIVKYVEGATANLTTDIARYEREITLLREYRTRLTADVVTGKLDVSTVAATLPEEELSDHDAATREPDDDTLDHDHLTETENNV